MRWWLPVVLLLGGALAGCAGKAPAAASDGTAASVDAPRMGTIVGLAVDDALRPLPGVAVHLQGGGSATSDAQGGFRFGPLAPGAYLLSANRTGYLALQVLAEVKAGEAAKVRLQLASAGVAQPYHDTFKFHGHAEASAGVATSVAARLAGGVATCACDFPFTTGGNLASILLEAAWTDQVPDPAGPTKYTWQVTVDGNDAQATGQDPSPIRRELQRLDFTNRSFDFAAHSAYTLHLYPDAAWPTANQDYEAFVTLWYLARPPPDWSIVSGTSP